jgi:hypothetical protein
MFNSSNLHQALARGSVKNPIVSINARCSPALFGAVIRGLFFASWFPLGEIHFEWLPNSKTSPAQLSSVKAIH